MRRKFSGFTDFAETVHTFSTQIINYLGLAKNSLMVTNTRELISKSYVELIISCPEASFPDNGTLIVNGREA